MPRTLAYALRRLAFVPVGLFVVASLAFAVVNLTPGDPASVIAGDQATDEVVAKIRSDLGLDESLGSRYVTYMGDLVRGDLGTSYFSGRPVLDQIAQRLPNSLELAFLSLIVAVVLGVILGGIAAYARGRAPERVSRLITSAAQSTPDFFLGLVLIYIFFSVLGIAPAPVGRLGLLEEAPPKVTGGILTDALIAGDWELVGSALRHAMLPVAALGIFYASMISKVTRGALSTAFDSEQVEFARANGLSLTKQIGYAMRQARTSILTYSAVVLATLIGGTAVVESIFAWGGIGHWMIDSVMKMDVPSIQGFVLLSGAVTFLVYLLLDLVVFALDPRIKVK